MWRRTLYVYRMVLQNKNTNILHLLCSCVLCPAKWPGNIQGCDCPQYWVPILGFWSQIKMFAVLSAPLWHRWEDRGTDDQVLRIGAPPKAVTLLWLPQPASQFHPTVNLRWRAPASQLNPIQHDISTKDAEGDGSCEDHQHNSNSKLYQQANKRAVILSGGNRNQWSY